MPISISTGGVAGITVETDPTALKLTGGTLSGKLNALTTATSAGVNLGHWTANPSTMVAGDIWIVDRLNFTNRLGNTVGVVTTNQVSTIATSASTPILQVDQTGSGGGLLVRSTSTTATGSAFRIENRGTGNSFVVEDTTTPDGSAFTIDQHGKVGIGIAPNATACLGLDSSGLQFGYSGTVVEDITMESAVNPPAGWNADTVSNAIRITIGGQFYYIPYWTA